MSSQTSVVSGKSLPPASEMQHVIKQFRRVWVRGKFHMGDFCMVTGLAEEQAKDCLSKAEQVGEVTALDGVYILKPRERRNERRQCNDWHFSVQRQQDIYEAVGSAGHQGSGVTFKAILERVPMGASTLKRYLRSMTQAGILVRELRSGRNVYWQGEKRWLQGGYWEYWNKQNQTSGG